MKDPLCILGILFLLFELYRLLRRNWVRRLLEQKRKEKRPRKPAVLRPKTERDCRLCQKDKGKRRVVKRDMPVSWQLRKGRGGRKKKVATVGYFCPNEACEYYGIMDEAIHALVGYGQQGKQEAIPDFKSEMIIRILWLQVLGVDASALEEVFGVREITIRTWLCRSGMQGKKLHERFLVELQLVNVQLDEAFGVAKRRVNVKEGSQDMWVWIASDAKTKVIPVIQVGDAVRRWPFRWCMN